MSDDILDHVYKEAPALEPVLEAEGAELAKEQLRSYIQLLVLGAFGAERDTLPAPSPDSGIYPPRPKE